MPGDLGDGQGKCLDPGGALIGVIAAAGPCTGRKVGVYVAAPGAIRTATLQEGARTVAIPVSRYRTSYRLPVSDPSFGNEAMIKLTTD